MSAGAKMDHRAHRASLKNPPKTHAEYLAELDTQGLTKSVAEIRLLIADGSSGL
jgi:hypothetical protein